MKRLLFAALLVMPLMCGLVSCSKETRPEPDSLTTNWGWTFNVAVPSPNSSLEMTGNTVKLAELLSTTHKDKEKYVHEVAVQSVSSDVKIKGLQAGQTIKSLSLKPSDSKIQSLELGQITGTGDDISISDNAVFQFLSKLGNSVCTNKSISLNLTASSGTQTISGVTVVITMRTRVSWR